MSDDIVVRVALVEAKLERLIKDLEERDDKLDQLLELKSKGMGAIWLATLICGSSLIAFLSTVISWIKG